MQRLVLPDLGLGDTPVVASVWHIEPGGEVIEGDRLLEVVAGSALVDLPSPCSGVLLRQLVAEDEVIAVGQVLAEIRPHAAESS
jgi:pyruvate/2-oxoglutarate dehydrogenase complex dihydrolipoamide acyltransferase (E2) component